MPKSKTVTPAADHFAANPKPEYGPPLTPDTIQKGMPVTAYNHKKHTIVRRGVVKDLGVISKSGFASNRSTFTHVLISYRDVDGIAAYELFAADGAGITPFPDGSMSRTTRTYFDRGQPKPKH